MRKSLGALLSIVGAVMIAYGIVSATAGLSSLPEGTCIGGGCAPPVSTFGVLGGGIVVFVVAAFMWPWSWITGPVSGLLAAVLFLAREGVSVLGDNLPFSLFIAGCVLLGPAILLTVAILGRRRAKKAAHLQATGSRAVAQIRGARQTGVYINNRPQLAVEYLVHPLDGSAPFTNAKTQVLDFAAVAPRVGLSFPAWYDPADPSEVAVAVPNGSAPDADTLALFQSFGLRPEQVYGYDPFTGVGR
ncbi:DUF3592 domain-containing protein [Euzebya tangerina]|uniref:DUF3592 domain-containing protein n=1 Tax=Euzebya tangerina TaxID=591198 RepID=UPI0013C2AC34|nr:DUF3592 domain-containing protein [Euzebya tangerina]